jgi:hypothetical protein
MDSIAKRRQPGGLAHSPEAWRGKVTRDLFAEYAKHDNFRDELRRLASDHRAALAELAPIRGHTFAWIASLPTPSDAVASYIAAIRLIADLWGLDRIGEVPLSNDDTDRPGLDALHAWAELAYHDPDEDGASFGFGHVVSSLAPGCDRAIRIDDLVDSWDPEEEPRSDAEEPIPSEAIRLVAPSKPETRIYLRDLYGGRAYRYFKGARSRLARVLPKGTKVQLLDSELNRIQAEYEALGYRFPDTRHDGTYRKYLLWTFKRLALYRPVSRIATEDGIPDQTTYVYRQLNIMKDVLGIRAFPLADRKDYDGPHRNLRKHKQQG